MSTLGDELRKRFKSPREAIKALGLDEALLQQDMENLMTTKPTKFANTALHLIAASVRPLLAKDAKIDLGPIVPLLSRANFDKAKVKMALDSALKGKLAKDAEPNMGHVATMLDHIGSMAKPETADESVSEPQHKAMEAAAHGESNLGIPPGVGREFAQADKGKSFDAEPFKAFLKEKGMGDEDIMKACDMMMPKAATDESPEEKAKREEEEKKKAEDAKRATDEAVTKAEEDKKKAEDAMKGMVTKDEMSAAISKAVADQKVADAAKQKALKDVFPIVGDLAMSFDSAEHVYRHVAKMKNVPGHDKITADDLPYFIAMLPKAGARPSSHTETMARDSAGDGFAERHPEVARIQTV
jgi:uncharacterized protein